MASSVERAKTLHIRTPSVKDISIGVLKGDIYTRESVREHIGEIEEWRNLLIHQRPVNAFKRFLEVCETSGASPEEAIEQCEYLIDFYDDLLEGF